MKAEKIVVASFQSLNKTSAGGIGQLGYKIANELHKHGQLSTFVVSSKGKFTTTFPSSPVSFWSKYYLYAINKFGNYIHLKPYVSRYVQEKLYDFFCANFLDASITKLIVTTPYLHRTFTKAKKLGIPIYFIPGNPEDNRIAELVTEENKKYGITDDDAYTYKKRLKYYNESMPLIDAIVTYSSVMEETYRKASHPAKILSIRGYLKPPFKNIEIKQQPDNGKFKVAFLAYSVLLKGLQYMLEAWKDLQHEDMELHVGGLIDKNVQAIIDREYSSLKNVYYHGLITDVPAFLNQKSVFVLSSIIDGAPVTVLEGMYSSLPIIVSENCGTKDIIDEGEIGWVIPIRDPAAIKEKVLIAFNNRERSIAMGKLAKSKIESYNMDSFVLDIVAAINKA